MEVILRQAVDNLGHPGDIEDVFERALAAITGYNPHTTH